MYLAQGYNMATRVRIEPPTSRSGVRRSTTRLTYIVKSGFDEVLIETKMHATMKVKMSLVLFVINIDLIYIYFCANILQRIELM